MANIRRTFQLSSVRSKKYQHTLALVLKVLLVIIFVVHASMWATRRPAIKITDPIVSGVHATDLATIKAITNEGLSKKAFFGLLHFDNAFLYPQTSMRSRMKETNEWVKEVNFVPTLHELRVNVVEREQHYLWCAGLASATSTVEDGTCYFADETGYIFAPSPGYSGFPFVRIVSDIGAKLDQPYGTSTLTEREFALVTEFLEVLRGKGYTPLIVEQVGDHDYRITTNAPWKLLWESDSDTERVMINLDVALNDMSKRKLEQPVREIDVRFGDKVFYK